VATYANTQDLVDHAKDIVPRCLTNPQRNDLFLESEPVDWCFELGKWPYVPRRFGITAAKLIDKLIARLKLTVTSGAVVTHVVKDLPAAKSGILVNDAIITLDGKPITDVRSFAAALDAVAPGQQTEVVLIRDGREIRLTMTPRFCAHLPKNSLRVVFESRSR
jgi:S1-C subfamily serine protease